MATEALKGSNGIKAMSSFLNVLISLLQTAIEKNVAIAQLSVQTENLSMKVELLLKKIQEMENNPDESLSRRYSSRLSLSSEDGKPESNLVFSGSDSKTIRKTEEEDEQKSVLNSELEWLLGSIPIIGSNDIKVHGTFIAVPRDKIKSAPRLAVLYQDVFTN
eukprot:scaffold3946_cov314-Ochromonas_danica.AAC.2